MGDDPIPYVQSFTNIKDNKKWRRLERQNRDVPMPLLFGCVHLLWHQVAKESPQTGVWDLTRTTPDDVFELGHNDSEAMVAALVDAGYLERTGITEVRVPNWEEVYKKVLMRRRSRTVQPRDPTGRFAPSPDREEPLRAVTVPHGADTDGDGADTDRKPKPRPDLNQKEGQVSHGRDNGRADSKEIFVGDLAGNPAKWKRMPRRPDECGYRPIDSPVPELDLSHIPRASIGIAELEDRLCHRQYFAAEDRDNVLLVAWPDEKWVDTADRRKALRDELERLGWDPWAAIVPRILDTTLPQAEKFLREYFEARAGPED